MNFDQHISLGVIFIVLIYFINSDWLSSTIIFLLIGSILPDIIEPSKYSSNKSFILNLFYDIFPNCSKGKSGPKHRAFFHSWKLFKIIFIITIISFILSIFWFNIFSFIFNLGIGYLLHLISDSISNIYKSRNIPKSEKYYPKFGLPLK